jgi:hypothetical protein
VYRKTLTTEYQKQAGTVAQLQRDQILPFLTRATEPRTSEIVPFPHNALRPVVLALMYEKGNRRAFAGWYPLFVPGAEVKVSKTGAKPSLTSLLDEAVAALEKEGDLQGQALAAVLLEEGKFILVVQDMDQNSADNLLKHWPGEQFKARKTSLLIQVAGAVPDALPSVQPSTPTAPPQPVPAEPEQAPNPEPTQPAAPPDPAAPSR